MCTSERGRHHSVGCSVYRPFGPAGSTLARQFFHPAGSPVRFDRWCAITPQRFEAAVKVHSRRAAIARRL
jgi:hypothetical protein